MGLPLEVGQAGGEHPTVGWGAACVPGRGRWRPGEQLQGAAPGRRLFLLQPVEMASSLLFDSQSGVLMVSFVRRENNTGRWQSRNSNLRLSGVKTLPFKQILPIGLAFCLFVFADVSM